MLQSHEESVSRRILKISIVLFLVISALAAIVWAFLSPKAGLLLMMVGVIGGIVPFSIYDYIEFSRYRKMEEHFPNFLEDFAEARKSGMTFPQAFLNISKADYGSLSKELKKSAHHLTWNIPFPKVMDRLAKRTSKSRMIRQAFTIINEAYASGGDVAEIMSTLATNISRVKQIEDERRSIMSQQVFIIYTIFFLFLIILIGVFYFITPFTDMSSRTTTSDIGIDLKGMSIFGKPLNYCATASFVCSFGEAVGFEEKGLYFKSLFFMMALIQGISSGIVAGQIGEGTMVAGVKHVGIMVTVAVILFVLFA